MSYKESKLDWKPSDVVLNDDFNRIEGNIDYLKINTVPVTTNILAGTGLSGGGALGSDRTISANFGTGSTQIARGNHTHTKSELGLSNVDNIKQASKVDFDEHVLERASKYGYGHVRLSDVMMNRPGSGQISISTEKNVEQTRTITIGEHNTVIIGGHGGPYLFNRGTNDRFDLKYGKLESISSVMYPKNQDIWIYVDNYTDTTMRLKLNPRDYGGKTVTIYWFKL